MNECLYFFLDFIFKKIISVLYLILYFLCKFSSVKQLKLLEKSK